MSFQRGLPSLGAKRVIECQDYSSCMSTKFRSSSKYFGCLKVRESQTLRSQATFVRAWTHFHVPHEYRAPVSCLRASVSCFQLGRRGGVNPFARGGEAVAMEGFEEEFALGECLDVLTPTGIRTGEVKKRFSSIFRSPLSFLNKNSALRSVSINSANT